MGIDHDRVKSRMIGLQMIDEKYKPRHVGLYCRLKPWEIVTKFSQKLTGFLSYYYKYLTYPTDLGAYYYILRYACLKTLAYRMKISVSKIHKVHGEKMNMKRTIRMIDSKTNTHTIKEGYVKFPRLNLYQTMQMKAVYVQLRERLLPTRPVGGVTGVVLANLGIDIGLHEGEERVGQRFLIGAVKIPLADPILVEACYWIVQFKKMRNKRNDSSSQGQRVFLKTLFFLPRFLKSSCYRAANNSKRRLCLTHKNEPANTVCLLDSVFLVDGYFYSFNPPLHTTPLRVNFCSKKRPNLQKDIVRVYSSSSSSAEVKDLVVLIPKECYLHLTLKTNGFNNFFYYFKHISCS